MSCKRLGYIGLHELRKSKLPFVSPIHFIRSKLPFLFAHVPNRGHCTVAGATTGSMLPRGDVSRAENE